MAFPIPAHLPRAGAAASQDNSTKILSKIAQATSKSLNARTASSWVGELDESIQQTKELIHLRILENSAAFERQFASSKSVLARLHLLTSKVDSLNDNLSNSETGLVPILLGGLEAHAALAQQALDADIAHDALSRLFEYVTVFKELSQSVDDGRLPEAVKLSEKLERLLREAPDSLTKADILLDIKRNFRIVNDRLDEQLGDSYARSISMSPSELIVRPAIQVRQSSTIISLPDILSSISSISLDAYLNSFRRDLTTHFIHYVIRQPTSISIISEADPSGTPSHRMTLYPAPPNSESLALPLHNLASILTFLATHFFPAFPEPQRHTFLKSLCKPLTSAILEELLIPLVPSSLASLPPFLELLTHAVTFEDEYVVHVLGKDRHERDLKAWADGVAGHYERKRRDNLLEESRVIICRREAEERTFRVEVAVEGLTSLDSPQVSGESVPTSTDDSHATMEETPSVADESGWAFDDTEDAEHTSEPEYSAATQPEVEVDLEEEDPSDAWGLNDEDESLTTNGTLHEDDNDPWDNAWDERPVSPPQPDVPSIPPALSPTRVPKFAKGLEKFSSRGKHPDSPASPAFISPPSPQPPAPSPPPEPQKQQQSQKEPTPIAVRETYAVSGCAKDVIGMVESALREGNELSSSGIFSTPLSSVNPPGLLILQCAPLVPDLFRALYGVTFSLELSSSPRLSMRFANDCRFMSGEMSRIADTEPSVDAVKDKLRESSDRLKIIASTAFEDNIEQEQDKLHQILGRADGFLDTADQEQFDACEVVITEVLREIRSIAHAWKAVLNKSNYYAAVGSVIDAALNRILEDILALHDIPEKESHRLSELCKILHSLEGLFVENPEAPSLVVAYVPSWLKYSYLSELLEASLADISYLFDEGTLVDFQVDELVQLVRALFADTPLRANAIKRILNGHPQSRQ